MKEHLPIEDYEISQTTLEDVFCHLARQEINYCVTEGGETLNTDEVGASMAEANGVVGREEDREDKCTSVVLQ